MTARSSLLTLALVAATSNAATTVMDTPLPYTIYRGGSACDAEGKLDSGIISSVTAMAQEGLFCENAIHLGADNEETTVYTKVSFTSCAAMELGYVFLDTYACTDAACSDCTDVGGIPVTANLIVPDYKPLPSADACWGIKSDSTGVTVLTQFDPNADTIGIEKYWTLYTDNSCMKDTVVVVATDGSKLSSPAAPSTASKAVALATTMVVVAISLLY